MREQEMWAIVKRVLGNTVHKVVIPAAMGASLALAGGCGDRSLPTGDLSVSSDINPGYRYAAPMPDGAALKYAAPMPDGAAIDSKPQPVPVPLYAAAAPDLGVEPQPQPDYAAPYPEADPKS